MSSEHDFLPNSNITNDELRRRLTHEFQVECGPVTPSTRRVLLKKLAKLENERNSVSGVALDNNHHNDSYPSDNSLNQVDESFVVNGKHDNGHHVPNESLLSYDISEEPQRAAKKGSPRRSSPRRKRTDEIEAIKTFQVSVVVDTCTHT